MDRFQQQVILLLLLLAFYCLPHFLVLVLSIYQIVTEPSNKLDEGPLLDIVKEISTRPGAYTNIIQQMIMPVVAAITAANAENLSIRGLQKWLFILPLATIFICILDALIFNTRSVLSDTDKGVVSQFFITTASNLAVYVMLFVGLTAVKERA
jgi:hypothetical protein